MSEESENPPEERGWDRRRTVGAVVGGVIVAAVIAMLVIGLANKDIGTSIQDALDEGERPNAPNATLPVLLEADGIGPVGEEVSLDSLRGKIVVLNFWASWCEPCKEEAPMLEAAWKRHRERGLVVLGVNAQDFEDDARDFVDRYGLTYPVVHDGPGSSLGRYGLTGFPETWWVDRAGRLVAYVQGEFTQEQLDANIEKALRPS